MDGQSQSGPTTIGQLGHHIGLHVSVNLAGMTVGGVLVSEEQWLSGIVVGLSALGDAVTIKLDTPLGGGEPRGLFHRPSKGEDMVAVDDPSRIRPMTLTQAHPGGVHDHIAELARAGKMVEAIREYRELNGATLDEARAAIDQLSR